METLSYILVIAGILFMLGGLYLIARPPKAEPVAQGVGDEVEKSLKAIGEFLDRFEARFRIGLAVMFFGLGLVAGGIYVVSLDAKNEAKDAKNAAESSVMAGRAT
jgi:hypothetical protein